MQVPIPADFLWGASTAAHQVEGGTHNQWSVWEQKNAQRLAATFEQRLSWLPEFASIKAEGTDPANYISGNGVEHYERYKDDFDMLVQLNMNAFRFSIEWSRIEPEEGKWDQQAIRHYHDYITELRRRGIEPLPTLWHWTMPVWFADKGGFEKRQNVQYFVRFAHKMVTEYGAELRYLLTLNEPNVYTVLSYFTGEWPPQRKSVWQSIRVYGVLARAHREAYAVIKRVKPELQVGIAMAMSGSTTDRKSDIIGKLVANVAGQAWNHWFLSRIRLQQDIIGVNYYFANHYHAVKRVYPRQPLNDLGWYMEPSNIEQVLISTWRRYKRPIIITENGLADAHDTHRKWWLEETPPSMYLSFPQFVVLLFFFHLFFLYIFYLSF